MKHSEIVAMESNISKAWPEVPRLSPMQWAILEGHYDLLRKWNGIINLVGRSTLENAALIHYAESLFLGAFVPSEVVTIADCGTGAGFPGYPVAVECPRMKITLIEGDKRKASFLKDAPGLPNLNIVSSRLEDLVGGFDACMARAVDPRIVLKWGRSKSKHFGFIGSEGDIRVLADSSLFRSVDVRALPWREGSAAMWGTFHVKP